MKLYNTLTRHLDDIQPLVAPKVTVYTCGPTVYDLAHVGHWFTYIREDLLIRSLKLAGLKPDWVMNITDVGHLVSDADDGEDKLEKGARREGKTAWEVADFYTKDFIDGLNRLAITMPGRLTKATDHIAEQIELIQTLETKGYTYVISDGVYYDTSKFSSYGDFARLDVDEQQAGARVEYNPEKRQLTDFALWKFSPENQSRDMEWDSPWGVGFPGWHIECSAMSMKYLGNTIDIHAGGIDHVPVHHTNEIAQSEAATGQTFANHWMHNNHVMIEGEKISKSLGNGITLDQIEAAGISLQAFRLHVLQSHYRSQSKFSWESLQSAQNQLHNWFAVADLCWQLTETAQDTSELVAKYRHMITEALLNDLDTPLVMRLISELFDNFNGKLSPAGSVALRDLFTFINQSLGIDLTNRPDITQAQKQLIAEREAARSNQDWAKSDELRDNLAQQGVVVRDSAEGTIWQLQP